MSIRRSGDLEDVVDREVLGDAHAYIGRLGAELEVRD